MNELVERIYNDFQRNTEDTTYIVELLIEQMEGCRNLCDSEKDYNKINEKVNELKTELAGLTYFDNVK